MTDTRQVERHDIADIVTMNASLDDRRLLHNLMQQPRRVTDLKERVRDNLTTDEAPARRWAMVRNTPRSAPAYTTMPFVLLTANSNWAVDQTEATLHRQRQDYADQVDGSDQALTRNNDLRSGGRLRHVRLALPANRQRGALLQAVVGGYDLARRHARGGAIGVMFGHGSGPTGQATVDLAPANLMLAFAGWMESIWRDRNGTQRSPESGAFMQIGATLRQRPRVSRVDFYNCALGGLTDTRRLLNWIHHLWQIPVRSAVGNIMLHTMPLTHATSLTILIPPGHRRRRYPTFLDDPIQGRDLWVRSRNRRPALLGQAHLATPYEPPPAPPLP